MGDSSGSTETDSTMISVLFMHRDRFAPRAEIPLFLPLTGCREIIRNNHRSPKDFPSLFRHAAIMLSR